MLGDGWVPCGPAGKVSQTPVDRTSVSLLLTAAGHRGGGGLQRSEVDEGGG